MSLREALDREFTWPPKAELDSVSAEIRVRMAAAFALRWAAANCTYDMRHEQVRHGDRERAIPVNDLEALADELENP